ncbi:MAG TPA: hypothetical protein VK208_12695 [Pyrinomonadaceae bacterium]|nr:hypothetical protein [Pyrinomonadaceae bacterium]
MNTTLTAGSFHVSPQAINSYSWVGNTFFDTVAHTQPGEMSLDLEIDLGNRSGGIDS